MAFRLRQLPQHAHLTVERFQIAAELGAEYQLREQCDETHITPWNTQQRFSFFHFCRRPR